MQRYSKQREEIYEYLRATKEHPTAEMVYSKLKSVMPALSLATVYRNLNLLVSENKAIKLDTGENVDRFDADTSPHHHFVCTKCHRVSDIFSEIITEKSLNKVLEGGYRAEGFKLFVYGICPECKNDR